MPEAFTEAFVAVIFFHGSYLKLPWNFVLKASVEKKYYSEG